MVERPSWNSRARVLAVSRSVMEVDHAQARDAQGPRVYAQVEEDAAKYV